MLDKKIIVMCAFKVGLADVGLEVEIDKNNSVDN